MPSRSAAYYDQQVPSKAQVEVSSDDDNDVIRASSTIVCSVNTKLMAKNMEDNDDLKNAWRSVSKT